MRLRRRGLRLLRPLRRRIKKGKQRSFEKGSAYFFRLLLRFPSLFRHGIMNVRTARKQASAFWAFIDGGHRRSMPGRVSPRRAGVTGLERPCGIYDRKGMAGSRGKTAEVHCPRRAGMTGLDGPRRIYDRVGKLSGICVRRRGSMDKMLGNFAFAG